MKKMLFCFGLMMCMVYMPSHLFALNEGYDAKSGIPFEYTPAEGSVEELYKDIIVTQLEPVMSAEVEKQYGKPLLYGLYDVEFLEIKRNAYRGFSFLIKAEVKPFVGAHNTIGIDQMVISVSPYGTKVESFEHIKSFPIPEHLKEQHKDLKL